MRQVDGVDVEETFAPVIKPPRVKIILSLAVTWGWALRQFDVSNAFLHGVLKEDVYMRQPPEYRDPDNPKGVCKLLKSIYGLRQSPRAWFHQLKDFIILFGFTESVSDQSLFIYLHGNIKAYFLVYIDDMILASSSKHFTNQFIMGISGEFTVKDLEPLRYFLGVHVNRLSNGAILLTQQQYLANLLHGAKLNNLKAVPIPMEDKGTLYLESLELNDNERTRFRQLVRSLQYLTLTQPNIVYNVNKISQFLAKPTKTHWTALQRILRFLSRTPFVGVVINKVKDLTLSAFSDAD